jgi:hypothetical protein
MPSVTLEDIMGGRASHFKIHNPSTRVGRRRKRRRSHHDCRRHLVAGCHHVHVLYRRHSALFRAGRSTGTGHASWPLAGHTAHLAGRQRILDRSHSTMCSCATFATRHYTRNTAASVVALSGKCATAAGSSRPR